MSFSFPTPYHSYHNSELRHPGVDEARSAGSNFHLNLSDDYEMWGAFQAVRDFANLEMRNDS